MNNTICKDKNCSTTRLVTREKPSIDKFESVLFLPEGKNRQGEGGLRTQGYFKKSYDDKPCISIITIVYNGEKHLEQTIQSVMNQNYENLEYIIIDGGSTDGTVDIIRQHEDNIDYWISESDTGISNAFNKGISQASGKYLLMLNCGDTFISNAVIDTDVLSGDESKIISYQSKTTHGNSFPSSYIYEVNHGGNCTAKINSVVQNSMVAHQATFVPKSVYEKIGRYNSDYSIRMDLEFFLRATQKFEIEFYQKPIVLYPTDGISSKLKNRIVFKMEELRAIHETLDNSCYLYDAYFFISLPWYLCKKLLSSLKYTFIDWKNNVITW